MGMSLLAPGIVWFGQRKSGAYCSQSRLMKDSE